MNTTHGPWINNMSVLEQCYTASVLSYSTEWMLVPVVQTKGALLTVTLELPEESMRLVDSKIKVE